MRRRYKKAEKASGRDGFIEEDSLVPGGPAIPLSARKGLTVLFESYIFNIRVFSEGNLKKEFNMGILIRTMALLAGLALMAAVPAWALDFEYEEYEVKRGDTLWDITYEKLEDPFNWPIVWRENPQIKDPDLIYPGQIIRIPMYLLKQPQRGLVKEVTEVKPPPPPPPPPEVKKPERATLEVRTDITEITADDILRGGYITRQVPRDGEIIGTPGERVILGKDDEAYITTTGTVNVGDRFYVIRKAEKVRHPKTDRSMGYLVRIMGILEVTRIGERDITALVLKSFDVIRVGDYLDTFYTVEPVILTGELRKPEVDGLTVAAVDMRVLNGMLEYVFIDRGSRDGLLPGDIIASIAPGTPDRANGVLMITNTREETATLVVVKSANPVSIGHEISSCAKVMGCSGE